MEHFFMFVFAENLNLRLDDEACAARAVEFDFAEEGEPRAREQGISIAFAMKPTGDQRATAVVFESSFEEAQCTTAKTGHFSMGDTGDYSRFLTGSKVGDGFEVAAVFVAKRSVVEEIRYGKKFLVDKHFGPGGAYAFNKLEGRREVQVYRGGRSLQILRLFNGTIRMGLYVFW
jgi:hypothetical protein